MITIALVCMGTAWVTSAVGLSLALGAFLAGVALAESEYSHQTLADAIPFRDVFVGLFFVSIGMLFDAHFVVRHPFGVVGIVAGVVLLKFVSGALPTLVLGYSWRVAVLVGIGMAQIGEFAFVLSRPGREAGLLPDEAFQTLLAAAILTMGLAPILYAGTPRLIRWGERQRWLDRRFAGQRGEALAHRKPPHEDHVIVAGYGVSGRNLVRALRTAEVPHVILELNPVRVRHARAAGEPIVYGDCTRPAVLERLGIRKARLLVIVISDAASARRAVQIARGLNPRLQIIVRTRYLQEVDPLRRLGADDVVPEEFETSIEILARVLQRYGTPAELISSVSEEIRADEYRLFRAPELPESPGAQGIDPGALDEPTGEAEVIEQRGEVRER